MKTINFILICILLTSCLTVKRIERNCDKFSRVCITDSRKVIEYRDTIIYKDRIIKVQLPKDTVKIVDTLYIENNKCFLPYTRKTFGNIWASAKVDNSILDLKAGYVKNVIQVPIHDTIYIERVVTRMRTENTVTLPPVKFIPKFYKFTFWFFILFIVSGAGWIFVKGKGGWIKKILK